MLARVALALVALPLVAWSAVLWRDDNVGEDASHKIIVSKDMSAAEFARELDRVRDASLLDPSTKWPIAEAGALMHRGRRAAAARVIEDVVRREPDNIEAWTVLREAAEGRDPARARRARAEIRRLSSPR